MIRGAPAHLLADQRRSIVRAGRPIFTRIGCAAGLLAAACLTAGCQAPDRWSVFDIDYDGRLAAEARRAAAHPVSVPDALQPAPPQTLPLPEGDGPMQLSIEQAAFLALQNNRDLEVQQLNPVIVGTFEQLERGLFDPELFASGSFNQEEASQTTDITGERFGVVREDYEVVGGVRQQLPTGTSIEVTAGNERAFSNRSPDQHAPRLGLSVTQSLLRGIDPAVNLASIRQAELNTLASIHELRGFTESLLGEVERAYWLYTLSRQEIAIFEQSLELARQQLAEVEDRIDVGLVAPTEAAAARAEVALRQQELIDARSELETRRLRLLRLVNPAGPDSLGAQVVPTSPPTIAAATIDDLPLRIKLAEQLRADLNEARLRLEQNRLQTLVTRHGLLPRLDVFIALGKTGFGGAFSDAVDDLDGPNFDFSAGASLSYVLGNRAAQARDEEARASRQQAAAAVANLAQLVELEVRLAATQVERARQQITATAATRVLREQTLRAEQERFRVGASTSLLVAQAQRDLVASQIAEVEAIIGYRIFLIDLYVAEGSLLERRGIRMALPPAR